MWSLSYADRQEIQRIYHKLLVKICTFSGYKTRVYFVFQERDLNKYAPFIYMYLMIMLQMNLILTLTQ